MRCTEPRTSLDCPAGSEPPVRRKKTTSKSPEQNSETLMGQKVGFLSLPQEVILMIVEFLDVDSILSLLRTSKWLFSVLSPCDSLWKLLCIKTELANYSCLETQPGTRQLGWAGLELHNTGGSDRAETGHWRRMWQRGLKMRRNIVAGNFQGWRLFSNTECPVAELVPARDMNKVKQDLGEFPKLSTNDDLKIDWDDKHLVLFHFFRGEGESCTIRLWDIQVRIVEIQTSNRRKNVEMVEN